MSHLTTNGPDGFSFHNLAQDVRYGIRVLWKSRGYTLVAMLSLGLGIGANAALFSLVDALLLRTLPVREAERLVSVGRTDLATGKLVPVDRDTLDAGHLDSVFTDAAMFLPMHRPSIAIGGAPEPARTVMHATSNFFQIRFDTGFDSSNLVQVELMRDWVRPPRGANAVEEVRRRYFAGQPQPSETFGAQVGPHFFETLRIPLVRGCSPRTTRRGRGMSRS